MSDEQISRYYIMYFAEEGRIEKEWTTLEEAKQIIDESIAELTKDFPTRLGNSCLGISWIGPKDIPEIVKQAEAYMWKKRENIDAHQHILPDYIYEINGWGSQAYVEAKQQEEYKKMIDNLEKDKYPRAIDGYKQYMKEMYGIVYEDK